MAQPLGGLENKERKRPNSTTSFLSDGGYDARSTIDASKWIRIKYYFFNSPLFFFSENHFTFQNIRLKIWPRWLRFLQNKIKMMEKKKIYCWNQKLYLANFSFHQNQNQNQNQPKPKSKTTIDWKIDSNRDPKNCPENCSARILLSWSAGWWNPWMSLRGWFPLHWSCWARKNTPPFDGVSPFTGENNHHCCSP